MRQTALVVSAVVLASTLHVRTASAQGSAFALVDSASPARTSGWTFTPTLAYQGAWDNNALLLFEPEPPQDFLSMLNPRADVTYLGKRSEFDASYDGAVVMYRQLNELNSYDQHATVSARRALTPRVTVSAHNGFAAVPTTELLNFVAVPFVRTGSKIDDFRTSVDVALTKFTTITGGYAFQWVSFDKQQPLHTALRGGYSHGASAAIKHELSDTTSIIGSWNLQRATLEDGGTFDVVNADAGFERQLLQSTRVFAAFGFSRLGVSQNALASVGPSYRAGITHQVGQTAISANYSRSYVPAFAFGGTFQNEELSAHVRTPIARRVYIESSLSWRRNEPLEPNSLRLKSFWFETTAGYALQPWARLEGFFIGEHQEIDRPGGNVGRRRIGFQIVTTKPVRIR